ncbi:MAG TPA: GMC family oxidoreductase N-terminal domain-containing protein [Rhizomicrobium sp.]|jgi:choline dehydrogenase
MSNAAAAQKAIKSTYDYIVVGAGASGCVVAGELSKTGAEILVIESGPADTAPTIASPSIWFYNLATPLNYALPLKPAPEVNNREIALALGHVLGGGSSINAMVWSRGMARDYDSWAESGAKGWAFKDVLPMFKAQEDWEGGANEWRGTGGPIHIRRPRDPHPTARAVVEAGKQMGFALLDDMNGPMRDGVGYINMNIARDGTRVSAAHAFLHPNLGRENLTLLLSTNVTRVVFGGDRASGIEIAAADGPRRLSAAREIILTAGTIHTAQLLMLSGIGEAAALKKLGIAPVADLRGVGRNFQDHVHLSGVVCQYKGQFPAHGADSDAVEAELNMSTGADGHGTDMVLVLEQLPNGSPELVARFGAALPENCFTISPSLVQPTSRGQVRLASADWRDPPTIEPNFLGTDRDLEATARGAQAARELVSQKAFDDIREAELIPGPSARSKADLIEFVRMGTMSFGHPIGTARMGEDTDAVVDSELRVHGVRGLRVADASVMPSIVSGATNAASIMIGGRAAEFIKSSR